MELLSNNARCILSQYQLQLTLRAPRQPGESAPAMEDMLKKGPVDPNRADMSGETPLMEARAHSRGLSSNMVVDGE